LYPKSERTCPPEKKSNFRQQTISLSPLFCLLLCSDCHLTVNSASYIKQPSSWNEEGMELRWRKAPTDWDPQSVHMWVQNKNRERAPAPAVRPPPRNKWLVCGVDYWAFTHTTGTALRWVYQQNSQRATLEDYLKNDYYYFYAKSFTSCAYWCPCHGMKLEYSDL
jgi:hypothetical protein